MSDFAVADLRPVDLFDDLTDDELALWEERGTRLLADVTWRPVTSIPIADTDGNPDTAADPDWLPLINTPSHPEYPAGHPSLNGAAPDGSVPASSTLPRRRQSRRRVADHSQHSDAS